MDHRETITSSLTDTAGIGALSDADRRRWNDAIAYYSITIAKQDFIFDSAAVRTNNRIAELEDAPSLRASGLDTSLVRVLDEAAPIYRATWWPRHRAEDRAWIAAITPLLARYDDSLSASMSWAFREPWPREPIRVDVSAYANWAGAYTTERPSRITVSSTAADYRGTNALEMLFHEAMHTMDFVVDSALTAAAARSGKKVTYDATHAVIFYTAGYEVQRLIPVHQPYGYAQGIWSGPLGRYEPALVRWWRPYLDHKIDFSEAVRGIVDSL